MGRTPKVYEPTDTDVHISIPAREHDLLADILIDAVLTQDQDKAGPEAALQIARHRGAQLGATEREQARPGRLSAERALTLATATLARYGFEPDRATPTLLRLRNCPFQPLTSKAPQLVCGINHAFLNGFLDSAAGAHPHRRTRPPHRLVLRRTHHQLNHTLRPPARTPTHTCMNHPPDPGDQPTSAHPRRTCLRAHVDPQRSVTTCAPRRDTPAQAGPDPR